MVRAMWDNVVPIVDEQQQLHQHVGLGNQCNQCIVCHCRVFGAVSGLTCHEMGTALSMAEKAIKQVGSSVQLLGSYVD